MQRKKILFRLKVNVGFYVCQRCSRDDFFLDCLSKYSKKVQEVRRMRGVVTGLKVAKC